MHFHRRGLPALARLLLLLLIPLPSPAQTQWTASTSSWFTGTNWTLGTPNSLTEAWIANGGTAQILAAPTAFTFALRVGRSTGSGNLLVSGPGALTVSGDTFINENAPATSSMTVQNGATVTSPTTVVGQSGTTNASLLITGANTTFNSNTSFSVGLSRGTTSLTLQAGAKLNTSTAAIGTGFLAGATATVTGANSLWYNTGAITVSDSAIDHGTLNILSSGTVYTTGLSIGADGDLVLNGGTLRTDTYSRHTSGSLAFTAGTLQLAGDRVVPGDPTVTDFFGPTTTVPTGKGLSVEGNLAFDGSNGPTSLVINGGSVFAPHVEIGFVSAAISAGGTLTAPSIDVAVSTISLTGAGSALSSNNLSINDASVVTVPAQTLISTGFLRINTSGRLDLTGGTVRLDNYEHTNGAATINYTSGTVQIGGNRTLDTEPVVAAFFGVLPSISANKTLAIDGNATLSGAAPLTLAGGALTAASLTLNPSSLLVSTQASTVTAPILALAGSTIDATAANLTIGNSAKVNGFYSNGMLIVGPSRTLTLADANDAALDTASLTTLGSPTTAATLSAPNGLTLNFGANLTGFGTVSTPNSATKPLINNGHIIGTDASHRLTLTGYVKGVGTLSNVTVTGTLAPGFSPATVYYDSVDYAGTLSIDVDSPTSYDVIHHSGPVTLAGALNLNLAPGLSLASLTHLQFLTAPSITGSFSSITGTLPDPTHAYVPLFSPTGIEFVATLPGDANLNGHIDPDDFALLDRGFTKHLTGFQNGDFNFDGSVTIADYLLADQNFLLQSPGDPSSLLSSRESQFGRGYVVELRSSIPEPDLSPSSILYPLFSLPLLRRRRHFISH